MADDKRAEDGGRLFFKSEIFKDGPSAGAAAGNYSSNIGAEQGLEVFGGGTSRQKRPRPTRPYREPARDIPVFAETDVLVLNEVLEACPHSTLVMNRLTGALGGDALVAIVFSNVGSFPARVLRRLW